MSGVCDHVFNIKSGSLYKAIFMSTGKLIKELRLKKGMTQEELAEKTDLSVRTIQRIEKGEVDPRAYTHQIIAEVLEVDFELLYSNNEPDIVNESNKAEKIWLPLLHISGLFLLFIPPLVIWISKKDSIISIKEHGVDVINFQFSMLLIIIPSGILAFSLITIPIIIFTGIFSTVIILINTIRVVNNQPYKYPVIIRLLKK